MGKILSDKLKLNITFHQGDVCSKNLGRTFDLVSDSCLLHCLVGIKERKDFFNNVRAHMKLSSRFFIYTMARESYEDDLSFPNDFFYFDKNSGILWSKGPDSFDVDWTQIEGENYFEHRRIYTYVEQRKELENNGFKIEKEKLIDQGVGQAKMFAAWLSLK